MANEIAKVNRTPKAYKDLPLRQRKFIDAYIRTNDAVSSYKAAGYKGQRSAKVQSAKLLKELKNHISDQVTQYVKGTELAIFGLKTLRDLAESSDSDAVRLNAAKELLARNLPEEPKEVHHHHTSDKKDMSDDELMAKLKKLNDKLFLEAPKAEVVKISGQ